MKRREDWSLDNEGGSRAEELKSDGQGWRRVVNKKIRNEIEWDKKRGEKQ